MSTHIYQDELIFPFDDSMDVVMNDGYIDERSSSTSYQCVDHKNVINEEDYQEYDSEDYSLCHLPNSIPKNSFAYIIPQTTRVQTPHVAVDISEDISIMLNSTNMSLDYNRSLSHYLVNTNSFEGSISLTNSTDTVYSSRIEAFQNNFPNDVYIPYTFGAYDNASFDDQNFSPPYSFNSQYSPPCDYNALVTLPNSPPQADHDVSASPEGHTRRTNNIKQLTCEICNKCFGRPQEVTRHQVCHTREKKFGCSTCDKKFARRDALLRHNRSHSKLKVKENSSIPVAK